MTEKDQIDNIRTLITLSYPGDHVFLLKFQSKKQWQVFKHDIKPKLLNKLSNYSGICQQNTLRLGAPSTSKLQAWKNALNYLKKYE